jgi:hypothetical protein
VTSSTEGCRLVTRTKYRLGKLQLHVRPFLAAVEFFLEPLQLLAFPIAMGLQWHNPFGPDSKPVFAGLKGVFAALMIYIPIPFWLLVIAALIPALIFIGACVPVNIKDSVHGGHFMQVGFAFWHILSQSRLWLRIINLVYFLTLTFSHTEK